MFFNEVIKKYILHFLLLPPFKLCIFIFVEIITHGAMLPSFEWEKIAFLWHYWSLISTKAPKINKYILSVC